MQHVREPVTFVLFLLGSTASAMLASGCAPQPFTRADLDGRIVCDADRIDAIEREARRNGSQIQWVNCPTVRLRVQD